MTAVGERTKRLQLGTSVLTPTFRYNPAVIAQAFATMACLYPDRIFLGVGTGEALNEIATGYEGDWPDFKERFARLRESVRLMRELWLGDRVDFEGEYYRTKGASIYDVPEAVCPYMWRPAVPWWPSTPDAPATGSSAPPARGGTVQGQAAARGRRGCRGRG